MEEKYNFVHYIRGEKRCELKDLEVDDKSNECESKND